MHHTRPSGRARLAPPAARAVIPLGMWPAGRPSPIWMGADSGCGPGPGAPGHEVRRELPPAPERPGRNPASCRAGTRRGM